MNDPDTDENGNEAGIVKIWFAGDNVEYANGETIRVGYDGNDLPLAFQLKNHPKETKTYRWQLYHSGIDRTEEVKSNENTLDNFGLNLKGRTGDIKLKVTYDTKEIEVILQTDKEEFELTELTATDKNKPKRIANSGKTLYLIKNDDQREVIYNLEINPDISNLSFSNQDIIWYYDVSNQQTKLGQDYGKKSITRNLAHEPTINKTKVKAGYPNFLEKSVDVEWAKYYDINKDIFEKFNKVLNFIQEFNKFSKKFGKVLPCEVNILNNLDALRGVNKASFNIRTFNKEDDNSREYFDIVQTSLKLKSSDLASLKCGKSLGWSSLSLGNIYVEASLGANIDFRYQVKTKNESGDVEIVPEVIGGLNFTPKFGLESNPDMSDYIYADINMNISAGTRAVWPYEGDKGKIANYFYLGNTNLSISGYVDGWLVGGKQEIDPPINFVLFNTYTESDTKLIFDIKNGEIYLEDN